MIWCSGLKVCMTATGVSRVEYKICIHARVVCDKRLSLELMVGRYDCSVGFLA